MRLCEFTTRSALPLTKLAVPTGTRGTEVADLQKVLVALGFPLPRFGIDGIRKHETNGAIRQFQQSVGLPASGEPDVATIDKLNAELARRPNIASRLTKTTVSDIKSSQPTNTSVNELPSTQNMSQARAAAEQYLGRVMSDREWNLLLRATAGEAGSNSTEQAYVMGVILNRARSGKWGPSIESVLTAKNQFQAVTGTRSNPGPSQVFNNPSRRLPSIINSAITVLNQVPQDFMYFTAASSAAYGPGTHIGFRSKLMRSPGSKVIGGTVFARELA